MSVVLSPDLYALLRNYHDVATSQIALMKSGVDPFDPRRLAILEKMQVDLARLVKPGDAALN